jgi:hypothetical protein
MLNLHTSFLDQYENGIVKRAMFQSSEDVRDAASFRIAYFRIITGRLESKAAPNAQMSDQGYQIKVNGEWYWTTQKQFNHLSEGQEVEVQAAGPTSD